MICKNKKFKIYILKYKLHKLKRKREKDYIHLSIIYSDKFSKTDSFEKLFPEIFNPIDIEIGRTQRTIERLKKIN
jgi:hypothetical protein